MSLQDAASGMFPAGKAQLDWNDPLTIAIEQQVTFAYGRKMRDRGPAGPEECGSDTWRGQPWRENSQRWGSRGGKHREYYSWLYGSTWAWKHNG